MKHLSKFSFFLIILLISLIKTQTPTEIKVSTEIQTKEISTSSINYYYKISLSSTASSSYKFIKILSTPTSSSGMSYLYVSLKDENPRQTVFDISSAEKGSNTLYIPRTFFEKDSQNFFYLNTYCEGGCSYKIEFQQVEMIFLERGVRLGFLTFDYEDYLIRFDKSEETKNSELMVTASGGAKGHHGTKNNVKLNLYYREEDGFETLIDVNSDTMFNGAGTTFIESSYTKQDNGYYVAKVRGPVNTYINFMVRKIGVLCDLEVEGKAIYGFLQGDDIDTFKLIGHGIEPESFNKNNNNNNNKNAERTFQLSIVVKGDLTISKSTQELCDIEDETETVNIKDELQAILTFTETEIAEGLQHICIQGRNQQVKSNAYIIEVHEVTDQSVATIVTEPLVNGYIYTDYLKQDEVRTYRHSKYLEEGLTKYNVKLNEGLIKVAYIKCTTFPVCKIDKNAVNGQKQEFISVIMKPIDNYYTANIDKSLETFAYGPTQYLLTVLCLSEKCKFEVSFSDDEDSLVLREDSRIAHYISAGSHNYYHFKISGTQEAKKVFVYLRTLSGDANIDVIDDVVEQKRYYLENTEVLEFYDTQFTGLYTLNVTGSIGSFYALSYSVIKPDEDEEEKVFDIGLGISVVETIKNGNTKKLFKMFHDSTRGNDLRYVANFYPINCEIKVTFFGSEVTPINDIYQHEIDKENPHYNEEYFKYQVDFIRFNDDSSYTDKQCIFHISSQELSTNSESAISEGSSIGFTLTTKTTNPGFIYPHSAGESDILIKYNLENNYPVKMDITINSFTQSSVYFSRSSSYVIPANLVKTYCTKDQVCGIGLRFSSRSQIDSQEKENGSEIPLNFVVKSKDKVPSFLRKNILQVDLVAQNSIQYYLVELSPQDKGEIVINYKKGMGKIFAKIVGRNDDPEDDSDWNNRVKLPTPEEQSPTVGVYDSYKQSIAYNAGSLIKYGIPVCINGCELYIGVMSTDEVKEDEEEENKIDYLEYSILVRPEVDTSSSDEDKHQQLMGQAAVDIPANEYITGSIESYSTVHYFQFDVTNDCDSIEIEFQSESCSLFINEGNKYPDPDPYSAQWTVKSKLTAAILVIKKEDIGVDNLKDHKFKISIGSPSYSEIFSNLYIFRVRVPKRTMKTIIEINSNIDTSCEVKEADGYCDLVYPLSDYEYESSSSLSVYAETEVISDIEIFFNRVTSYDFDNLNEDQIKQYLPRPENNQKSTENQNIKNFIELTREDFRPEGESQVKPFALISIKSSKPGIIKVYTSMREQVTKTSINAYSLLLYKISNVPINFDIEANNQHTFLITCIDGEGEAYFLSQEEDESTHKKISGSGSLISMRLPQKKNDVLIIKSNNNDSNKSGVIFYIEESIHAEVRSMELIKYGFSGRISYEESSIEFPIIYYMKIQDEEESVNVNLHLDNLLTGFDPKDGENYTVTFDINGYVVNEDLVSSMMRNKRVNPPINQAIRGRYDKSLTTAKLYITSKQIQEIYSDSNKYILVSLNVNDNTFYNIYGFDTDISIMPFSNQLYNSPYNLYISGNLLKEKDSPLCNYHRLRAGNLEDKYMQIEFGILSPKVTYKIIDLNDKEIKYYEKISKSNGKYKGIIELQKEKENNLVLEFCKKENIQLTHESSSNYIFKVKSSSSSNNLKTHLLKSNKLSYEFKYNDGDNSSLDIKIPKILNADGTKVAEATYTIRLFSYSSFENDESLNTISFISYYPYASYIYTISKETDDLSDIKSLIVKRIENFPGNEPYLVSVIGVTSDEDEEIFSYEVIEDPYTVPSDDSQTKYVYILIIIVVISIIVLSIFGFILLRLRKKNRDLDKEVQEISMKLSHNPGNLGGQNTDPANEPFIKSVKDL